MWKLQLADIIELLSETRLVLLIGLGTAGLAFAVGWTTMRKRKTKTPAPSPADPFTDGGTNERRSASRRGGHAVTVEMNDPDEKQSQQHGWVVDRSIGGLCLMVPSAVPVGSIWKVRPSEAPRTTPPVRVEVKTCIPEGHEWKLGCQFERVPSYAVLLMFG
jgi:hypothetical protein